MSERAKKLGIAGWFALVVLLGLLAWALWYGVHVWTALDGVEMSGAGWTFLVLGAVLSILVGGGLMALVFYSNRNDYDR